MRAFLLSIIMISFSSSFLYAEEWNPLLLSDENARKITSRATDVLVIGQITANALTLWKHHESRKDWKCLILRNSVGLAANFAIKKYSNRLRPNGEDRDSFYSMHEMLAATNQEWSNIHGISASVLIGLGRIASGSHYNSDVAVGYLAGDLSKHMCKWFNWDTQKIVVNGEVIHIHKDM